MHDDDGAVMRSATDDDATTRERGLCELQPKDDEQEDGK
jgi:hypothetical protein